MRESYYDRRAADRWKWASWMLVGLVLTFWVLKVADSFRDCRNRGGVYSFRAGICFAPAAVIRP